MASDPPAPTPAATDPVAPTSVEGVIVSSAPANPSIGLATVGGGGISLAAFAGAIASIASGNPGPESYSLLATGVVLLLVVLLGRYKQAWEIARSVLGGASAALPESDTK